jgi:hypothetical protein
MTVYSRIAVGKLELHMAVEEAALSGVSRRGLRVDCAWLVAPWREELRHPRQPVLAEASKTPQGSARYPSCLRPANLIPRRIVHGNHQGQGLSAWPSGSDLAALLFQALSRPFWQPGELIPQP